MSNFFQYALDAVSVGALFATAGLGIGLIFGVMRLINFAYGDYITWGAYALVVPSTAQVAHKLIGAWPAPLLAAAIVAIVMTLALVTERVAFRPLREAGSATLLISSFAVSYLLQNLILLVHSGRPKSINLWPALTNSVSLAGGRVPLIDLATMATCLVLLAAIAGFLKYSPYGIEMRAAAENFKMARLLGIRADRVIALAFAISGLLAAATSLLLVVKTGVLDYREGVPLALVAFVATVVGGMGSMLGAGLGGFLIGIATVVLQVVLPEELRGARDAFVFGFVIFVLLVRPEGLIRPTAWQERV
jgi:branched-chain amino acid transport system permease protein